MERKRKDKFFLDDRDKWFQKLMTHSRVIHIFEKILTKFRPKFPTFRLILLINCTIDLNCVCLFQGVSLFRDILWKERMENFESTIFRASEFYKCHCRPFWNIYIYIYLTLYLNLQHFCTRHLFFATSIPFAFSSHMFTTRCIRVCDRFNLKIVQK